MRNNKIWFLPIIAIVFTQCAVLKQKNKVQYVEIVQEGYFSCFENGLQSKDKPMWCEASAIHYDGQKLYLANDKEMPDERSSVFYWNWKNNFADTSTNANYLANPVLKKGLKYEDFASTPDGKYILLTTAFDRVKGKGNTEWDGYNSLVYWEKDEQQDVKVVSFNGTDSTSISLREPIAKVLSTNEYPEGMPYFKIEGMAVTDKKIIWGVREYGKKYDEFQYAAKLISVSYKVQNNRIVIQNDFQILADIDVKLLAPQILETVAISSIEYDKYNNRFYILTSFEDGDKIGAYLWTATFNELQSGKIHLMKSKDGNLIKFNNKAEDMTIVSKNKILIIHDDDRVLTEINGQKRKPNQAGYSLIGVK